ncbi:cell surface glycoprotein 1 isoform X1 [Dermacentor silvarum]|uniref:cell surface glycoprotein 1 isoform X1 n=1 Tax=Dermacentor silvarum TaxID=543639 RepID=UPI00189B11F5|nr:cell surface glycoprotein 1 isoform X1 [Dermacentor silvarum]
MAESGSVIRVKLDLRSAHPRRGPHDLVWSIVDKAVTTTISQFEKLIRTKYAVPSESELYLDDALLPPDEPIQILSDKDTVRIVTAAQQPSNSDSHADDDPESSLTIDKPIKTEVKRERPEIGEPINEEVKRESPEINEPIKTEVKRERPKIGEPIKTEVKQEPPESHDTPVVEADEVSGSAGPGHSNSFESTTKQDVTPCFAVSQVKSTPIFYIVSTSTTPQNQSPASTPGWPVFTPDPGLRSPAMKKRRRRRKKKPAEECVQVAESPSSPQVPLVCIPSHLAQAVLPTGKQRWFDGDTPGRAKVAALQQNTLPTPAKQPPCIVYLTAPTKSTEKECQLPLKNGQDSQAPAAASCHSAVHAPPEVVTAEAKKVSAIVKPRFTEDDWAQDSQDLF